ncbi:MAG: bifunctional phosphoribosyl-AMP cyclohydrolase/phosphoribosyl-ATP diphosphatase HisIE [Bacteroidota bacterium]
MIDIEKIDFDKGDGLVPCIIQDINTKNCLMLGYMNEEALRNTLRDQKVTFWSRSKNRLWMKGEQSGNYLLLKNIKSDCDNDALLVLVEPIGPTCHTGTDTCWSESNKTNALLLEKLEQTIVSRKNNPSESSYTASLFARGINKVAQKVGEEAVELVIEAKDDNKELFLNEAADLMYHFIVLLVAKGFSIKDVVQVLRERER